MGDREKLIARITSGSGSDAELNLSVAELEDIKDKAENLLIAIGMGWDMDGSFDGLKAALDASEGAAVLSDPNVGVE